jgi:hypothetical protein
MPDEIIDQRKKRPLPLRQNLERQRSGCIDSEHRPPPYRH